jgi:hypothetical protein
VRGTLRSLGRDRRPRRGTRSREVPAGTRVVCCEPAGGPECRPRARRPLPFRFAVCSA